MRTDDLAAHVLTALVTRQRGARARFVDQVVFGATNQAGEDNRNVARMASLLAGCLRGARGDREPPLRLRARGRHRRGDARLNGRRRGRPWRGRREHDARALRHEKSEGGLRPHAAAIYDTTLGWRFENPRMAARFPLHSMGETAENVAEKWNISRDEQDEFALASQKKAAGAIAAGAFDSEIVPVHDRAEEREPAGRRKDESPRPDTTMEALAASRRSFARGGRSPPATARPSTTGRAAVLVVSEDVVKAHALEPLARVVAFATAGVEPN